ncbi:MAG: Uma2 family endonuclease [Planctomycetes bacterium]|nr:Uma2 family endonuclease [Planctomycetota bacterium]
MSVALKTPLPSPAAEGPLLPGLVYQFTVEQYQQMIEAGIFTANDRVELLEGWIIHKMTQNPPHAVAVDYAQEILRAMLPAAWKVREQKPIQTSDSQPEPDLAIVQGPAGRYEARHPKPSEIVLLIEVADTTLLDDRNWKGRLYARARIPVYWIINLVDGKVEVYTQPKGGKAPAYRERRDYGQEESVPLMLAGQQIGHIPVRDLLPGRTGMVK